MRPFYEVSNNNQVWFEGLARLDFSTGVFNPTLYIVEYTHNPQSFNTRMFNFTDIDNDIAAYDVYRSPNYKLRVAWLLPHNEMVSGYGYKPRLFI